MTVANILQEEVIIASIVRPIIVVYSRFGYIQCKLQFTIVIMFGYSGCHEVRTKSM